MDTARNWMGVLLVVSLPPALAYWYVAHPFASFWRRLGARRALTILLTGLALGLWGMWLVREWALGTDLGTNFALVGPAALMYSISIVLETKIRKHLKLNTLVGLPEFSQADKKGQVLSQGIYGRIRHPRYVTIVIGVFGWALFVNYVGVYVLAILTVPGLYLVAVLEERELLERFGDEYARYSERVPRFVPRLGDR
ncbi:MAG: hypothetical protein BMS9Abin29_0823 [Gemmatimonadota bacterium]|nr:MAG: hypothetical protein BMS9Abin29_0823 [Gemmatimonadota bacterium]